MLRSLPFLFLTTCTLGAAAQAAPPDAPHVFVAVRERVNATQWFGATSAASQYGHDDSLIRFGLAQRLGRFDYMVELENATELFLPADAVAGVAPQGQLGLGGTYYASNGNNRFPSAVSLRQAFARVRFKPASSEVKLGRFEFFEGQETAPKDSTLAWLQANRVGQHLLGNFGFANAQRSFDGGQARAGGDNWDLTLMAARAVGGVFNMNANPELNVDAEYLAFTRSLAGKHILLRGFASGYHDGRTAVLKTDNRSAAARAADHNPIRIGTFGGSAILTAPVPGGVAEGVLWAAGQTGEWGRLSHRAGAFTAEAGFRATSLRWKPWLRAGTWRSTGDSNSTDGTHNTFFAMLNTPRVYARFPFFNLMNLNDSFVQLIADPTPKLQLRSDLRDLRLTEKNDLWYGGGGAFDNSVFGFTGRPGAPGGRSLATLADLSADLKLRSNLSLTAYYAHAFGKATVRNIYPAVSGANYGYLEVNYRFDRALQRHTPKRAN